MANKDEKFKKGMEERRELKAKAEARAKAEKAKKARTVALYTIGGVLLAALMALLIWQPWGSGGKPKTPPAEVSHNEPSAEVSHNEPSAEASSEVSKDETSRGFRHDMKTKHHVEMAVKDYGVIKLELDPTYAPITVDNFLNLAESGFYDGLTFHRIISGFMIQGGDPKHDGTGGSGTNIKGEFASNGVENPMQHKRGVISMARAGNPNSASSQFFIMHADAPHLDGDYAAFGHVTEGMDVVDAIAKINNDSVPYEKQPVIEKVTVLD